MELNITRFFEDAAPMDYSASRKNSEEGRVGGRIYKGDDAQVYYYVGE